MKRITIFILLLAPLLAGCHQDKVVAPIESESFALLETIDDEKLNPLPSEQTESSYQRVTEASKPEEFTDSTELPQTTQPSTYQSEESTESETEETVSVNEQTEADIPPATEAPPKTEVQEPQHNEELPSQPVTEPTESEPTTSSQPVTEPELEPTEEIESEETQETEPATETANPFEIGTWISFAQSYAQSIGLNLDSAAVDCWDNPITAGAHCIYLERDICSRLDRYNRDEDITDVWIWAVEIGNGCYDLYIGYIRYCFELKIIVQHPTSVKRVSFLLREDVTKLDRFDAQVRLLNREGIDTLEQLTAYQTDAEAKISSLAEQRVQLRNDLKRASRSGNTEDAAAIKAQIAAVSKEIRKLRKEVGLCTDIEQRSTQIESNLEQLMTEQETERKENERDEHISRSSRSGRAHDA